MVQITTFGCRMNMHDSKILEADFQEEDALIINTCCITREAERQCRQKIRKLARDNPDKKIYVTGCSSALHPEYYAAYTVLPRVDASKPKHVDFDSRVRAFIPIQTGCDNACTYCIVPSVRGKAKHFPEETILKQIDYALSAGVIEIVLTGIDLASYPDLSQLIRKILSSFPTLLRLRFGSFDPARITDDFIALFKNEPRLMPHLHLSLQHASDPILKRMRRRHLSDDVSKAIRKLRVIRPDMVFGADIITGFPTETDADFDFLCQFVKENNIALLHVFPYSERPGTPAALMPSVPVPTRKARAKTLRGISQELKNTLYQTYINKDAIVLLEEGGFGYTETYLPVNISTDLENTLVRVKITGIQKGELVGGIL